jgi:hypothetical protein
MTGFVRPVSSKLCETGDEEEGYKPSQLEGRCWVRRETANSHPFVNEEMLLPQGSD